MSASLPTIERRTLFALWLVTGTLACLLCLYHFSATLVDGEFIPADHDSFYHAHRILDALDAPLDLIQFDPLIHAPEGSWVTWPWAYDTAMAALAGALLGSGVVAEPMIALAFVAPLWVYVNAALLLMIGVRLALPLPLLGLAMLCFATSTLTRALHRVGMLDHHFIEYSFVLGVLLIGLRWFGDLARHRPALLLGVMLGAAPAFHNGMFILQLPVLLSFAALWLLGRDLPRRPSQLFAIALTLSTLLMLLPSQPFMQGMFFYYLHSWFHLYIAICTSLFLVLPTIFARTPRNAIALLMLAIVAAIPVLRQFLAGSDFVFGNLTGFEALYETRTVWTWVMAGHWQHLNELYSGLVWLLPLALLGLIAFTCKRPRNEQIFFAVSCVFGSALLLRQFRLEYFGSYALYLPWLVLIGAALQRWPQRRTVMLLTTAGVFVLAYLPSLNAARAALPPANDHQYLLLRDVYPILERHCAAEPGVVLAEHGDGHYITFHTTCGVIADNFILTPQHESKVVESNRLLSADLDFVMQHAPWVRYIYVRRKDNIYDFPGCYPNCPENAGLRRELFAVDSDTDQRLELLFEKKIVRDGREEPFARAFRVVR